jgi:cytochrome c553
MKKILPWLLLLALLPSAVLADDDGEGEYAGQERARLLQPAKVNPTWAKECSACHIAYAPGLLPADSWRKLMSGLDKHFKADASLSAKENQEITAFLVANAANRWTGNAAPMRITETQWFKSQHNGREVPAEVWKRASVKSASNCQACHAGADRGDFSERSIKIPR